MGDDARYECGQKNSDTVYALMLTLASVITQLVSCMEDSAHFMMKSLYIHECGGGVGGLWKNHTSGFNLVCTIECSVEDCQNKVMLDTRSNEVFAKQKFRRSKGIVDCVEGGGGGGGDG